MSFVVTFFQLKIITYMSQSKYVHSMHPLSLLENIKIMYLTCAQNVIFMHVNYAYI